MCSFMEESVYHFSLTNWQLLIRRKSLSLLREFFEQCSQQLFCVPVFSYPLFFKATRTQESRSAVWEIHTRDPSFLYNQMQPVRMEAEFTQVLTLGTFRTKFTLNKGGSTGWDLASLTMNGPNIKIKVSFSMKPSRCVIMSWVPTTIRVIRLTFLVRSINPVSVITLKLKACPFASFPNWSENSS